MPPGKKSEKGSTVAGNGKGATRFGPKGPATADAVREIASGWGEDPAGPFACAANRTASFGGLSDGAVSVRVLLSVC